MNWAAMGEQMFEHLFRFLAALRRPGTICQADAARLLRLAFDHAPRLQLVQMPDHGRRGQIRPAANLANAGGTSLMPLDIVVNEVIHGLGVFRRSWVRLFSFRA